VGSSLPRSVADEPPEHYASKLGMENARLSPHVPTSVALMRLLDDAPADRVSLAWLISRLGKRSFGLLILIVAFLGLAPAIAMLAMLLLPFPAIQMALGHEHPSIPHFLATRSISTQRLSRLAVQSIPFLRRMEVFIHPRWPTPFQTTKRLVGLTILVLAVTLIAPFPFNVVPTLVIMLISFAYLEEDGILLCISIVAAIFSLLITAGTVMATVRTTGFLEGLWTRP
jgi:hypothetical protein